MLEKLKSWFRMELTKVDEVMHRFHETITQLERVAMAHAARAEEHLHEVQFHSQKQLEAQAESLKAQKTVAKLKDLLG